MTLISLIGFAGRKRAGKDTAAEALVKVGYERIAFADALKAMTAALLKYRGASPALISRVLDGDMKEAPLDELHGRSARYALQTLGTEWGRDLMSPDFWAAAALDHAAQFDRVVISDVRFKNEIEAIHALGGSVVWVERQGLVSTGEHVSEAAIGADDCDTVIVNSYATPVSFMRSVPPSISHLSKLRPPQ